MPKLRRMRLSCIGYDSARFDDVTLDFTNRQGEPTNSILWLRNGGGKTSLLSLLFAGLRTNKRDFLGQRAEEKVRRMSDYVGRQDHGIVVCEWELDAEQSLFNDDRPRYLSGVFYKRKDEDGGGEPDVDRLYFATLVSSKTPELTLEGLPLYTDEQGDHRRRTFNSFRRRWRQLDQEFPDHGVFLEDKNQSKFEEELALHGIDPEVFFYQIRMNEREGGVSERFSFAEDEDFIDFLLEMTFDQRHARQVRDQLSTFRQEIYERNEQLRPELDCCRGLVSRLQRLAGLANERAGVLRDTALAQGTLSGLAAWIIGWMANRQAEVSQVRSQVSASEQAGDEAIAAAGCALRLMVAHQRRSVQLRRDETQAEYERDEIKFHKARRNREAWQAAIPLAQARDHRAQAKELRTQLERKLQEFAPELDRLRECATQFANALEADAQGARQEATGHDLTAHRLCQEAKDLRTNADRANEEAVTAEQQAKNLRSSLAKAEGEARRLRTQGILQEQDLTIADALARLQREEAGEQAMIESREQEHQDARRRQESVRPQRTDAERDRSAQASALAVRKQLGEQAGVRRLALERDAALLRLLQTEQVDVDAACTGAVIKATEELKRLTDEILRVRVEAAEDERAIHSLEETQLLPPTQEVQLLVGWLREQGIKCWAGWEYISSTIESSRQRQVVSRLPYLAAGVVVLNADYDRVLDLCRPDQSDRDVPYLRSPLVVAPADALQDECDVLWTVVGPTSDAHFDKLAGAQEMNRLLDGRAGRQKTLGQHAEWQDALVTLKTKLQQFHADYPRGWFSEHQQQVEAAEAKLDEATRLVRQLDDELQELQAVMDNAATQLAALRLALAERRRQRERLEEYERTYGAHLQQWQSEANACDTRGAAARARQGELREQADAADSDSREAAKQSQAATMRGGQFDLERSKVKHVDESLRSAVIGPLEELRTRYELLLADYEGKVNADTLGQMAAHCDREADKAAREFDRICGKATELTAAEVETTLDGLPSGSTAQQQYEAACSTHDDCFQRFGSTSNRLKAVKLELTKAEQDCTNAAAEGPLPEVPVLASHEAHLAAAATAARERDEQTQLAAELRREAEGLTRRFAILERDLASTAKDQLRLSSLETNFQPELARLPTDKPAAATSAWTVPATMDNPELVKRIDQVERQLVTVRGKHAQLDQQREEAVKEVSNWSRQDRFTKLHSSVSSRFIDRPPVALEAHAEVDICQLEDRIFQITAKLQEADKHRDLVVQVLTGAVDEALALLGRVSRLSKLPERLPQAGQQFVKIETKASEIPQERRAHVAEFIDEQLEHGEVGDGLQLIQKAVRRVARRITVRVLHPDLHHKTERVSMSDMRRFSGGERLTMAILLYCALIRLRRGESNRKTGSNVLILDNPIGTASRVSFLDMQREVARAMNVQLIYATAVKDLNAVGALENVIRLRNTRVDRRTGRHYIEVEGNDSRQVAAARIVFDTAPGSQVSGNGHAGNGSPHAKDQASDVS